MNKPGLMICDGLYVTTEPLPGRAEEVPAGVLVMLQRASAHATPVLRLPSKSEHNRWRFQEQGHAVEDAAYLETLQARPDQGYYLLNQGLHLNEEMVVPERTLVQLSYSRLGTPILHISQFHDNAIVFPEVGYKFSQEVLGLLREAGFRTPPPREERQLH